MALSPFTMTEAPKLAGVLGDQAIEALDAHVVEVADARPRTIAMRSLGVEERPLLHRSRRHRHHDLVEQARGALDDVDVPVRDRVVRPGTDGDAVPLALIGPPPGGGR